MLNMAVLFPNWIHDCTQLVCFLCSSDYALPCTLQFYFSQSTLPWRSTMPFVVWARKKNKLTHKVVFTIFENSTKNLRNVLNICTVKNQLANRSLYVFIMMTRPVSNGKLNWRTFNKSADDVVTEVVVVFFSLFPFVVNEWKTWYIANYVAECLPCKKTTDTKHFFQQMKQRYSFFRAKKKFA